MASKVRVYGKAQNRTALGIAHAYMVMYPQATLEDLRKAFPNELNPDKGTKEIFIYAHEKLLQGLSGSLISLQADSGYLYTESPRKFC